MKGMQAYHRMFVCAARAPILTVGVIIGALWPVAAHAWGAVAFDTQSTAHGVSINRATRAEAEQQALAACAGQTINQATRERACQIVFTANRTGFLAVAAGEGAIGVSLAFSADRAGHSAMQACQQNAQQATAAMTDRSSTTTGRLPCQVIWRGEEKIGDGEPYNFLEPTYEWRGTRPVPPPPPRPEDR